MLSHLCGLRLSVVIIQGLNLILFLYFINVVRLIWKIKQREDIQLPLSLAAVKPHVSLKMYTCQAISKTFLYNEKYKNKKKIKILSNIEFL